jgi:WS/DGAT/MGAT family acyltransferase
MTVAVAPSDLTWLLMDRPNNLMYVHGLMWFDETPDWDAVERVLRERLVERFPVFGRRAREVEGTWVWEDDPDFSLHHHVRRTVLPAPGRLAEAETYISTRLSQPFDMARPLWEMDFVDGAHLAPAGDAGDGGDGAMVLARFHHGIADGVRLVQVLLSLLDPLSDDVLPTTVGRSRSGRGVVDQGVALARTTVVGTGDVISGTASALVRAPGWVTRLRPGSVATGVRRLRQPTWVTDALSEVASLDNKVANTWRSTARLALSGRSVDTVWSGTPSVEKKAAWITGISVTGVRDIGAAHGATINDVLLSAVSLGLTEYLASKGADEVEQVVWMVPVSLTPISAEPPKHLGNKFAVVLMPMPLGLREPDRLIREVHRRMTRIKNSAEPAMIFGIQRAIAEVPSAVGVALTNYVANKSVGVLTNVPGPRAAMALAGTEVRGILGWVPASGDQTLGICIFSYNGSVSIGLAVDAALVPDPDVLASHIEQAVHTLAADGGTP